MRCFQQAEVSASAVLGDDSAAEPPWGQVSLTSFAQSLSPDTCLISLMSQVITSGELIRYSTPAATGLVSAKTWERSLTHNMQANKGKGTPEAPPHPLSLVLETFSPKHFFG